MLTRAYTRATARPSLDARWERKKNRQWFRKCRGALGMLVTICVDRILASSVGIQDYRGVAVFCATE